MDYRKAKIESRINKLLQNGKNSESSGIVAKLRRKLRKESV